MTTRRLPVSPHESSMGHGPPMTYRILLADDERDLRDMLHAYLSNEGFEVKAVSNGQAALEAALGGQPDLVILDIGMPGLDGFEVLRRLRSQSQVPVIFLTAKTEEVDRVVGLTVGADDYVTKPFSPRELTARIRAVLRRGRMTTVGESLLSFEGIEINMAGREVWRDGEAVDLTTLEFDLLAALAGAPGRVLTREHLLETVWGWDYFGVDRVVDVHISNLRKLLGDDPSEPAVIATVRGVGYKFIAKPT